MGWSTVYLVIAIIAGIMGIWNLARQSNIFLALTGILWFLVVLLERSLPKVYDMHIVAGIPNVGTLFLYVVIPLFIILAFFGPGRR